MWHGTLIATPALRRHSLSEEDELLIVASDGLWDVVSGLEAVQLVRAHIRQTGHAQGQSRDETAEMLVSAQPWFTPLSFQ